MAEPQPVFPLFRRAEVERQGGSHRVRGTYLTHRRTLQLATFTHAAELQGALRLTDNLLWHLVPFFQLAKEPVTVAGTDGAKGQRPTELARPTYVFVARDGALFISDSDNHRVQRWAPSLSGPCRTSTVAGGRGIKRDLDGLHSPQGLWVTEGSNPECATSAEAEHWEVYVAELFNDRITRWAKGAKRGEVVAGGNGRGSGAAELDGPCGVVMSAGNGGLYISDNGNNRVVYWPLGAASGITVAGGGVDPYSNEPLLRTPIGIAVQPNGDIFVVETGTDRVVLWRQGESAAKVVLQCAERAWPEGIAVSPQGDVLVACKAKVLLLRADAVHRAVEKGEAAPEEAAEELPGVDPAIGLFVFPEGDAALVVGKHPDQHRVQLVTV